VDLRCPVISRVADLHPPPVLPTSQRRQTGSQDSCVGDSPRPSVKESVLGDSLPRVPSRLPPLPPLLAPRIPPDRPPSGPHGSWSPGNVRRMGCPGGGSRLGPLPQVSEDCLPVCRDGRALPLPPGPRLLRPLSPGDKFCQSPRLQSRPGAGRVRHNCHRVLLAPRR